MYLVLKNLNELTYFYKYFSTLHLQTSHNKTVETTVPSVYYTPHNSTLPIYDRSADTSVDSRGSKGEFIYFLNAFVLFHKFTYK